MRIVEHDRMPTQNEVELSGDPMSVWLDTHVCLTIEEGDSLGKVVRGITPYMSEYLDGEQLEQLVAFWFAMGERNENDRLNEKWNKRELSTDRKRRYLQ